MAEGKDAGRKRKANLAGNREINRQDRKLKAIELFIAGRTVAEIAAELNCNLTIVYDYIKETRTEILQTKRDYFAARTALLIDHLFEAVCAHTILLADEEFLRAAAPEKAEALAKVAGILADKLFLLANAASQRAVDRQQPALPQGGGEPDGTDATG